MKNIFLAAAVISIIFSGRADSAGQMKTDIRPEIYNLRWEEESLQKKRKVASKVGNGFEIVIAASVKNTIDGTPAIFRIYPKCYTGDKSSYFAELKSEVKNGNAEIKWEAKCHKDLSVLKEEEIIEYVFTCETGGIISGESPKVMLDFVWVLELMGPKGSYADDVYILRTKDNKYNKKVRVRDYYKFDAVQNTVSLKFEGVKPGLFYRPEMIIAESRQRQVLTFEQDFKDFAVIMRELPERELPECKISEEDREKYAKPIMPRTEYKESLTDKLISAAYEGDNALVQALIKKGAKVNAKDKAGVTALREACHEGNAETVMLLLKNRADIDHAGFNGYTPLHVAVMENKIEVVRILLENKASVNIKDVDGHVPLNHATGEGVEQTEIVKLLLHHKAKVNIANKWGDTALMGAVDHENIKTLELLIKSGAAPDLKDREGRAALMMAMHKNIKLIELLIGGGAKLDLKNKEGETPLMIAIENQYLDKAKLLIEKGANVNATDKQGTSVLIKACQEGNAEIVRLLVLKNADVNLTSPGDDAALFYAIDNIEIVKILLGNNASVNVKNVVGETPLICAVMDETEQLETVKLLIDARADVNVKDSSDKTALDYALENKHNNIVKILKEAGAVE